LQGTASSVIWTRRSIRSAYSYTFNCAGDRTSGGNALNADQQYVWSPRYVDSPILRDSYSGGTLVPADRLYYLTDAGHNVTAVANSAGVVQERYDYDVFGKATIYNAVWSQVRTSSLVGNTRLFAGQDVDPTTGLQYARARWYNSSIGGFVGRDPLGFAAGQMDLYCYCGNNPTNYTDPSGEVHGVPASVGGAAIGAVVSGTTYIVACALTHHCMSWGGFLGAVANAAVAGGILGATLSGDPLTAMVWGAFAGGIGGEVGSIVQQSIDTGSINWGAVRDAGALGMLFGAFGSGLGTLFAGPGLPGGGLFALANGGSWGTSLAAGGLTVQAGGAGIGSGLDVVLTQRSPEIGPSELTGQSRDGIRDLARDKGLSPAGKPDPVDGLPRKWNDPVTGEPRIRLDHGHIDPETGLPYDNPRAASDHVHGYEPDGTPIRDPVTGDKHFPTMDEWNV
jgi:RHS repeat-associated protein